MDIRDLCIGDCVRYRNREWQVCSLYQFTGEVGLWRKDSQLCENISDIEPIPITPEILLKNGFKEHIFPDQYRNAEKCIIVRAGKEWDFNTAIEEYRMIGRYQSLYGLQFVHELQHALRVAGVEKEFVCE